jgi:hypothetical protein
MNWAVAHYFGKVGRFFEVSRVEEKYQVVMSAHASLSRDQHMQQEGNRGSG